MAEFFPVASGGESGGSPAFDRTVVVNSGSASVEVTSADSNKIFVNENEGSNTTYNLPPATVLGLIYTFFIGNLGANLITTIEPDGTDVLYRAGSSEPLSDLAIDGTMESDQYGSYITLVCVEQGIWLETSGFYLI